MGALGWIAILGSLMSLIGNVISIAYLYRDEVRHDYHDAPEDTNEDKWMPREE